MSYTHKDYHLFINYMKMLRSHFQREHNELYTFSKIYKGSPDYSYFSLTTDDFKKNKLKFVIVFQHSSKLFSICLSGQNKDVREHYLKVLQKREWDSYLLADSSKSLMILNHNIIKAADLSDEHNLNELIELESMKFIDTITGVLFA